MGGQVLYIERQRGLNTMRTTIVFFWVPRNLFHHMFRQARTDDAVLVKSRELTHTLLLLLGVEGVKTAENKIHWRRCRKRYVPIVKYRILAVIVP
jgi:hypothetical protein